MAKQPQDGKHLILKPIRYHGEGELHRKLILPEDGLALTFAHLTDAGYALLIRKRVIQPASAADIKLLEEAKKAKEEAKTDRQKTAEAIRANQKAAALAKQIKQAGDQ